MKVSSEELRKSPLVRLPIVEALATTYRDQGRVLPEARALQRVLRRALADAIRDLPGSRLAGLAEAIREGRSQADFARRIGIREETVTRTLKPRLVVLVQLQVEAIQERYLTDQHKHDPPPRAPDEGEPAEAEENDHV